MYKKTLIASCFITLLTAACVATPHSADDTPSPVYIIGAPAYAEAVAAGRPPMKMGRLSPEHIPDSLPPSFLETDGSYAGGTVYPTVIEAQEGIIAMQKAKLLPLGIKWEVFLLQADWRKDVYQLRKGEWRLSRNAYVLSKADY